MAASDLVLSLVRGYASRAKQVTLRYPQFVQFVRRYASSHQGQHPVLDAMASDPAPVLRPALEDLARAGECELQVIGGEIDTILVLKYLMDKLDAAYREIDDNPEIPFPTEESVGLAFPAGGATISIKTEFIKWIGAQPAARSVLRLSFPEDIASILVTSDLFARKLLDLSLMKIHSYLANGRNGSYLAQKLGEVFTLRDQAIQSMIHEIITRPSAVADGFKNPTEFNFAFWAHLVSVILKEFKAKTEKLPQEQGYCQASYLIGLYNVYYKGLAQREQDIEAALKGVETRITAEPYYFTISEIYAFPDDKGVALTRRCPKDRIDAFLEEKTARSKEDLLPEIVRVHTTNDREYFIPRGAVARLALTKSFQAARLYRESYVQEWFQLLGSFKKSPVMLQDDAFVEDLERRVGEDDPLLSALLSFNLLYLARQGMVVQDEVAMRLDRILDLKSQALIPFDELLGLHRRELLSEARLKLPVWKTIPLLRHLFRLLDRMFTGRSEAAGERASRRKRGAREESDAMLGLAEMEEFVGVEEDDSEADSLMPLEGEAGSSGGAEGRPTHAEAGEGGLRSLFESRAAASGRRSQPAGAAGGAAGPSTSTASTATSKQRMAAYRKAVEALKERLIGKGVAIDVRLKELAVKWNPLYADKPKQDLIEDVNSFIRDQIRSIRRSLLTKPPDLARIKNLARQISENEVFSEIKRKEEFREYIQLYMIKILGRV